MEQARGETRAEAEAAAEQRFAAALALERVEFNKQARSWLNMRGNRDIAALPWPPLHCCTVCASECEWSRFACHALAAWAMLMDMSCSAEAPVLLMMPSS